MKVSQRQDKFIEVKRRYVKSGRGMKISENLKEVTRTKNRLHNIIGIDYANLK